MPAIVYGMEGKQFKKQEPIERPSSIELVPLSLIRVSDRQSRRVSRDKVERHRMRLELEKGAEDLLPLDASRLEDGTYIIDGNGRHRFLAYTEAGISHIPLNIKQNKGFRPTKK